MKPVTLVTHNRLPWSKEIDLIIQLNDDGSVSVVALDDDGEEICNLITFEKNGRITREIAVEHDIGFDLNNHGQIKATDED